MQPTIKPIIEPLEKIAALGYDFPRVYDDFLSLSVHAFAQREEEYLAVMGKYRNDRALGEREADYFAVALAEWQKNLQTEYRDYLGEIYEQRVSFGEKGQFFTPENICELLTQITCPELPDGYRVYDPACGSGRTLLSATRVNRMATFHGVDLDHRCVKMTALNLLCRNVNGTVVWGDTLRLKAFGAYELHRTPMGGVIEWVGDNRAQELIEKGLRLQASPETVQVTSPINPDDAEELSEDNQYSLGL